VIKEYLALTKPGIIRGNLLSTIAGFLLASTLFDIQLFVAILSGTALIIASGCVLNNYIDRDIDAHMERTKKRALVTKTIPPKNAVLFGVLLGILGFAILWLFTNMTTVIVGLVGWVSYVFIYDYVKRHSLYGTLVGAIPGATPPVAGYTAVTGSIDSSALLLFIILFTWQMPHFYAIALFRSKEYAAAHIPTLPIIKGVKETKVHMLLFAMAFGVSSVLLYSFDYVSLLYLITMSIVSGMWVYIIYSGFTDKNTTAWAKKVFGFSLLILIVFSMLMFIEFLFR
jgi:protoheme IX farnesyltransferase